MPDLLKFPGYSLEKSLESYIGSDVCGVIFVEVKRAKRGQWVFAFEDDDSAYFEGNISGSVSAGTKSPSKKAFKSAKTSASKD